MRDEPKAEGLRWLEQAQADLSWGRSKMSIGAAWVRAIQVNLMGSVLVCRAVLPHFKAHGKVLVVVSATGGVE